MEHSSRDHKRKCCPRICPIFKWSH
jgi:hypothetical protein